MKRALNKIGCILTLITMMITLPVASLGGATGGPKEGNIRLDANTYTKINVSFNARELAFIGLKGNGNTDLDIYVLDQNNKLIISDTDNSDTCLVEWVPALTETFTIYVVNRGNIHNDFYIMTN